MFEGFSVDQIDVGDVTLRVRHGGHGDAVVLLVEDRPGLSDVARNDAIHLDQPAGARLHVDNDHRRQTPSGPGVRAE